MIYDGGNSVFEFNVRIDSMKRMFSQNNLVDNEIDTLLFLQIVYQHLSISANYANRESCVHLCMII